MDYKYTQRLLAPTLPSTNGSRFWINAEYRNKSSAPLFLHKDIAYFCLY